MRRLLLIRTVSIDDGTFGHCFHGDLHLVTCEPEAPRAGNKGRIPTGIYRCEWVPGEKFIGYMLRAVPGFEGVRIHSGNDELDTTGCILVGIRRGIDARNKESVLDSRRALAAFHLYMKQESFDLDIREEIAYA